MSEYNPDNHCNVCGCFNCVNNRGYVNPDKYDGRVIHLGDGAPALRLGELVLSIQDCPTRSAIIKAQEEMGKIAWIFKKRGVIAEALQLLDDPIRVDAVGVMLASKVSHPS